MLIELGHYFIIMALISFIIIPIYKIYNNIRYHLQKVINYYLYKNSKLIIQIKNIFNYINLFYINNHKLNIDNYTLINIISIGFLFLTIALICLFYSYISSDFSVINIIENSHSNQELLYKFCGVWGNHEGSILFWSWVLSLYCFIICIFNKSYNNIFFVNILNIQSFTIIFFIIFTIFTSNPFMRIIFFSFNGMELNPILQDPTLAIHPPFLYFGYLGFSLCFSLSIYILYQKFIYRSWIYYIKLFNIISWTLLTFGIGLGSWWAYYELGWGGWWFWDSVENASLIPWLLATALLHNLQINEKIICFKSLEFIIRFINLSIQFNGHFFCTVWIVNISTQFQSRLY